MAVPFRSATSSSRRRSAARNRLRLESLEPRQVLAASLVAVGSDYGATSTPLIRLLDADTGAVVAQTLAFEEAFRGGVRVAMANVDGRPGDEILAASGPGRIGEIRVFTQDVSGGVTTLRELVGFRLEPFGNGYQGGVQVAAGDVDGDHLTDIVAAASRGAGRVSVFRGIGLGEPVAGVPYRSFTAFTPTALAGASVAVADLGTFVDGQLVDGTRGDGRLEVVVGSGPGMAAKVKAFDLSAATPHQIDVIRPFGGSFRGGVSVAAGRFNADLIDDVVASPGSGGSGTEVYDGRVDAAARLLRFAAFTGLDRPAAAAYAAGIDRNGDGRIDGFVATQGFAGVNVNGAAVTSQQGSRTRAVTAFRGPLRVAAPRVAFDDFVATLSGMKYRVVTPGSGSLPTAGQRVRAQYTGWLLDGTKFDSSRDRGTPFEFTLGRGDVIRGWDEIIAQMRPGERRTVVIPPELAYGSTARTGIPANSTLVFDIELVSAA
ncbi:MAG: FKBP-type peptidyl-prolyl cis-trans isomerase [Pirellulales bacterium]